MRSADEITGFLRHYETLAYSDNSAGIMNDSMSDREVYETSGTGSSTPGWDKIPSALIGKADNYRCAGIFCFCWPKFSKSENLRNLPSFWSVGSRA